MSSAIEKEMKIDKIKRKKLVTPRRSSVLPRALSRLNLRLPICETFNEFVLENDVARKVVNKFTGKCGQAVKGAAETLQPCPSRIFAFPAHIHFVE